LLAEIRVFFQPDPDSDFLIAITIAIENRSQINQGLIFIFQADPDEKNSGRPCLIFF